MSTKLKQGTFLKNWSKDLIVFTLFCEKFGVSNLLSGEYNEESALLKLANYYIGSSDGSLKLQMENMRYLLSNGQDGLSCVSKTQRNVFNELNGLSKNDLKNVCFEIMETINTEEVYKKFNRIQVENKVISNIMKAEKEAEKKRTTYNEARRKEQIEMVALRLGKNPKKLITKEEYLKKQALLLTK